MCTFAMHLGSGWLQMEALQVELAAVGLGVPGHGPIDGDGIGDDRICFIGRTVEELAYMQRQEACVRGMPLSSPCNVIL